MGTSDHLDYLFDWCKEENQMGETSRSNRKVEETGKAIDRISQLPDDILRSILSSLTMREAVRTGILSSGWRHLWTDNPNLNLSGRTMFLVDPLVSILFEDLSVEFRRSVLKLRTHVLTRMVDNVLRCHRGSGIEMFKVNFSLDKENAHHLDEWITFAIASGVKELDLTLSERCFLYFFPKNPYDFPFHLFAGGRGSSLTRLCLECCTFKPPPNFDGFRSLKALGLVKVPLNDPDIQNILSYCYSLEWLCVRRCWKLVTIKISHPICPLKYFSVFLCLSLEEIELNAINLLTFEYNGPRISFKFRNLPRLIRTRIYFEGEEEPCNYLDYVLTRLPSVLPLLETLFLTFRGPFQAGILPQSFHKFTHLKCLSIYAWEVDIVWVALLLNAAPLLANFHLALSRPLGDHESSLPGKMRKPSGRCPHYHLRTVEITGFTASISQLELAVYAFSNAEALELMTLDPRSKYYNGDNEWLHNKLANVDDADVVRLMALTHLQSEVPPGVHVVLQ